MIKAKSSKKFTKQNAEDFRSALLDWYDHHARILPWRYKTGQKPDPYRVWLSEIMLQQTTVTAVAPYFIKFTEKWPTVVALAAARNEDIMHEWAGLGYYRRARNLHKCAGIVANELNGIFPDDPPALKKLPGIGDYTSAAIRSIAFNKPAVVVDGNIERITARIFAFPKPMPGAKKELKELAGAFFDGFDTRPGDLAQAMMDLGAGICKPKSPKCGLCPVSRHCAAYKAGIVETLPAQSAKKARPKKFGHVYWITNSRGEVLLQRRQPWELLGGMMGLPTSEWLDKKSAPHPAIFKTVKFEDFGRKASIQHSFTHFDLTLRLKTGHIGKAKPGAGYFWEPFANIEQTGFPTVFRKAARLFLRVNPNG